MNRSQLIAAIMAWLHRSVLRTPVANEFDATAGFIALAEQDINERLRARCMIRRVKQVIDGQYTALPSDFLEPFDLRLAGGGPPLTYVTRENTANTYWQHTASSPGPNPAAGTSLPPDFYPTIEAPGWPWGDGTPRHFTVVGEEIEWSPFPTVPEGTDAADFNWPQAELAYFQRQCLGTGPQDTNNVLTVYPATYIYGSLIHASPFLRDDSRATLWKDMYDTAIGGANAEAERARTQNTPLRANFRRLA